MQGLTLARAEHYSQPLPLLRLWAHECERVFQDRLLSAPEASAFKSMLANVATQHFPSVGDEVGKRCSG